MRKYEMESTLIEIINSSKSNFVVGCMYEHPSMSLTDLTNNCLNNLLDKVSNEQKYMFFFKVVSMLNYNDHNPTI